MCKRCLSILTVCTLTVAFWAAFNPGGRVHHAYAAAYTVTKLADTNDGICDSDCSLREAIIAANATPDADLITLPAGSFVIGISGRSENHAARGDFDITAPLTITGAGAEQTIFNAAGLDRVFDVRSTAGEVTITGVQITNGNTDNASGGGIACNEATLALNHVSILHSNAGQASGGGLHAAGCTVTLTDSVITHNTAYQGGGLNAGDGVMKLHRSIVSNNTSLGGGAGIFFNVNAVSLNESVIQANITAQESGGGILMIGATSTLTITSSLIAANQAVNEGGGIYLIGGQFATIENSTVSGNIAGTYGGGIDTRVPTSITHSTIVNNIADSNATNDGRGGGVFAYLSSGQVSTANTIIANNIDRSNTSRPDIACMSSGSVTSLGYNLIEQTTGCTITGNSGDIFGSDPLLAALTDRGGSTQLHALLNGSPAIDAGNPAFTPPPDYDQRGEGFPRVRDGRVDIGAFEFTVWDKFFLPLLAP